MNIKYSVVGFGFIHVIAILNIKMELWQPTWQWSEYYLGAALLLLSEVIDTCGEDSEENGLQLVDESLQGDIIIQGELTILLVWKWYVFCL